MRKILAKFQKLGKALMLPVAVLPIAGLLLRFGQPDMLNIAVLAKAGDALFSNLPLLFSIGIAVGIARDGNGAAALAGAVSYFVLNSSVQAVSYANKVGTIFGPLPKELNKVDMYHFGGIIAGVIAGVCYNKFHNIKLPEWLGFFGGKRFVPIVTGGCSIVIGSIFGFIWPIFQSGIDSVSNQMIATGGIGAFVYGTLNRLLLPAGLHHVLNFFVFFNCGTFTKTDGTVVTGELDRFFAGDPNGGMLTAGFFPVMMFALPAAALAMYVCANKKNKPIVGGAFLSVAITSFVTGITSPLEYMFMFCAPVLFVIHGLLTGVSVAVCQMLGIRDGFSFSAGVIDYCINWTSATNGWLIIPIGLILGSVYFLLFVFAIKKFNIPTPGRLDDESIEVTENEKVEVGEGA